MKGRRLRTRIAACGIRAIVAGVTLAGTGVSLAIAQTSSWSSKTEMPEAAPKPAPKAAAPKATAPAHPQPALPAAKTPAPLKGHLETKSSPGFSKVAPSATAATGNVAATGDDAAYIAYDQGQYLTALSLAEKAAAKGDPQAHTLIARIHAEGLAVRRDEKLSAQWYQRAAELGDPEAAFALGMMFAEGRGVDRNYAAAADLLEKAARTGHPYANYNLGQLFLYGRGKPENPYRGAQHIAYAAEKGVALAQYDLATLYHTGTGVPADAYESSRWLRRAAEQGMPEAQFDYAVALLGGKGINSDMPKAIDYLRAAAEKGIPGAQNRLAYVYFEGIRTAKNPKDGAKWRLIAKASGIPDDKLDKLVASLTAADRRAAETAAAEWHDRSLLGGGLQ